MMIVRIVYYLLSESLGYWVVQDGWICHLFLESLYHCTFFARTMNITKSFFHLSNACYDLSLLFSKPCFFAILQ